MTEYFILTILIIVLILVITTLVFLIFCLPKKLEIKIISNKREARTEIHRVPGEERNIYLVDFIQKQETRTRNIFRESTGIQTDLEKKQVRFGENIYAQLDKAKEFKPFRNFNKPYSSLPEISSDKIQPPSSIYPKITVEDFEEEEGEKETEPDKGEVPEEEHETDDELQEELEERQPLNTVHTLDIDQSVNTHLQQSQDWDTLSEVLITRLARIERRLKQNNI